MKHSLTMLIVALMLWSVASVQAADQAKTVVEPISITKIVADGRHNAFTALRQWKGQYWLSFRKADGHGYGEADVHVLRSADGEKWEEVYKVNALPDDRDPQFLATKDRLFLYTPSLKGGDLTTFVSYTDDGKTWTKPEPVYQPRYILWKPLEQGGKYYASAHLKSNDGKERDVHLITSDDGINWKKISLIRGGNWESETTIHFTDDDTIVAFLRQKYGSPQSSILEATKPFTKWTPRPAGYHLSGHAVNTFDDVVYLFSRTREGKEMGTMIYTYQDGKLVPYCRLPSGGDCSYPEAVQVGDEMLVSYYSSHEGATNVYLARVPLMKKGK